MSFQCLFEPELEGAAVRPSAGPLAGVSTQVSTHQVLYCTHSTVAVGICNMTKSLCTSINQKQIGNVGQHISRVKVTLVLWFMLATRSFMKQFIPVSSRMLHDKGTLPGDSSTRSISHPQGAHNHLPLRRRRPIRRLTLSWCKSWQSQQDRTGDKSVVFITRSTSEQQNIRALM